MNGPDRYLLISNLVSFLPAFFVGDDHGRLPGDAKSRTVPRGVLLKVILLFFTSKVTKINEYEM